MELGSRRLVKSLRSELPRPQGSLVNWRSQLKSAAVNGRLALTLEVFGSGSKRLIPHKQRGKKKRFQRVRSGRMTKFSSITVILIIN